MESWIISEYLAQTERARITLAYESPKAKMRREWDELRKRGHAACVKPSVGIFWLMAVVERVKDRLSVLATPESFRLTH